MNTYCSAQKGMLDDYYYLTELTLNAYLQATLSMCPVRVVPSSLIHARAADGSHVLEISVSAPQPPVDFILSENHCALVNIASS